MSAINNTTTIKIASSMIINGVNYLRYKYFIESKEFDADKIFHNYFNDNSSKRIQLNRKAIKEMINNKLSKK